MDIIPLPSVYSFWPARHTGNPHLITLNWTGSYIAKWALSGKSCDHDFAFWMETRLISFSPWAFVCLQIIPPGACLYFVQIKRNVITLAVWGWKPQVHSGKCLQYSLETSSSPISLLWERGRKKQAIFVGDLFFAWPFPTASAIPLLSMCIRANYFLS